MAGSTIYRVIFYNENSIYEIYAREIYQGEMYGFVEVEELLFGERSSVVVDPAEEKLKTEFAGTSRTYIPMHAIIRIDEVEKEGPVKISEPSGKGSNVARFPSPVYTPGNDSGS
jgi:hypothetical protein